MPLKKQTHKNVVFSHGAMNFHSCVGNLFLKVNFVNKDVVESQLC